MRAKKDAMAHRQFEDQFNSHQNGSFQQVRVVPLTPVSNDYQSDLSSNMGHGYAETSYAQSSYGDTQQYYAPSQAHVYRPGPPKQPRPIIIASNIDKSDFRTHIDGLTDGVRSKLGKAFGFGGKQQKGQQQAAKHFHAQPPFEQPPQPPAVTAVPSLIHSAHSDPAMARTNVYRPGPQSVRSGSRQGGGPASLGRRDSGLSNGPDIQVFSGNKKGRGAWRTLPNVCDLKMNILNLC